MGTCTVKVDPGVCQLKSTITAKMGDDGMTVNVKIESDCKFVRSFGEALKPIEAYTEFSLPVLQNPVYICASEHLQHSACPVACATLKAIEVAADLGLKRDVHFTIE